ncbi:MAG: hypothetical protein H6722_19340 [Sandaracinus sp.]|nr:hypothetical protein [Sandaracinus sp.]
MRRIALLGFLLGACGGSTTNVSTTTVGVTQITQNITVAWGDAGPSNEVDFEDPRLVRAMEETTQMMGREIDFRFDLRMMPRPLGAFFEGFFERQVGRVPRDLEQLARRDADVHAFALVSLRAVHFDYDGSREVTVVFEPQEGILRYRLGDAHVPEGGASWALRRAYLDHLRQTYTGVQVGALERPDFPHWFRYVREIGDRGDREAKAKVLIDLLAFEERLGREGETALQQTVRTYVLRKADRFREEYQRRLAEVQALPTSSPWRAAEAAFVTFVQRRWSEFTAQEKVRLLEDLLVRRFNVRREDDPYVREAFPGLDVLGLALGEMDAWLAAGKPAPYPTSDRDHAQRLFDEIVCAPRPHDSQRYQRGRCDSEVYRFASLEPTQRERLFRFVREKNDPALTEALFVNLRWLGSPFLIDAWRFFEDDEAQWRIGARVIGDLLDYGGPDQRGALYDESVRLWREHPSRRGPLLYVLSRLEPNAVSRVVAWDEFRRVFGSLATRADLDDFLALGDDAMVRVAKVVPALAANVNVGDALAPRLDPRMADDELRRRVPFFPHRMLNELVTALKARRDAASLASLRRFLQQRAAAHPSEERGLQTLIQMTSR